MVKVYAHTISQGGISSNAPHKRTPEAIERLGYRGAEIIAGTEEDVDAGSIDGEGRYIPKHHGNGA
jgi:hypothetical protein